MTQNRITINGQQYDSPEAMPADVRSLYEEAMRTAGSSLASGERGGSTQVFASRSGATNVVVSRSITVNGRTYGSADELPPDVRQLYADALKVAASQAGAVHPKVSMHMSVNFTRPGTHDDSREPSPLPIESSSTESRIRGLPTSLAIIIFIALVVWFFLGR